MRPLFRLFYQVEIRHPQLHSMISHSLRAMSIQYDYSNCVIVDTANPRSRVCYWFDDILVTFTSSLPRLRGRGGGVVLRVDTQGNAPRLPRRRR
jgi:hypothetical protein